MGLRSVSGASRGDWQARAFFALFFAAALLFQTASAGSLSVPSQINSTGDLYVGSGAISFFVNATSGNVGVGTSSPNSTLHIRAADNSSVPLKVESLVDFPFLGAYRKKITLAGSSAGALTDYQMRLTVYKASGTDSGSSVYLSNHVQDDFDDIRFTSADGVTPLSYWIENYSYGVSAVVWVKFDSVPAAPANSTFYIYYGNANAASGSNGANTFIVFDDFNDNNFDSTKWNAVGNSQYSSKLYQGYIRERNSRLELGPGTVSYALNFGIYSKATGCKRLVMSARRYPAVDSSFSIGTGSPVIGNTTPNPYMLSSPMGGNHPWYGIMPGNGYSLVFSSGMGLEKVVAGVESNLSYSAVTTGTDNDSVVYELAVGSAGVNASRNGSLLLQSTDTTFSSGYVMVAASHVGYAFVDWIFGANYVSSEPAWGAWGVEEDVSSVVRGQQSVLYVKPAVGYIGLGTTNPQAKLGVRGGLRVDSSSGSIFFVNESTGSVGIGTKSPGAALQVVSSVSVSGGSGGNVTDVVVDNVLYRIHTFTTVGNSTFTPPAGVTSVEYLVVAGGGAGSSTNGGGGGGGGGFLTGTASVSGNVSVVVGAGGVGSASIGMNGSNSSFGTINAMGGGGSPNGGNGFNGGSGGGGGIAAISYLGGSGFPGQGYNGGNNNVASPYPGGGGGGAGGAGANGAGSQSGVGGIGRASSITGTLTYYAGGGGGGQSAQGAVWGAGGLGGGGNGGTASSPAPQSGTNGLGGGGGAGGNGGGISGSGGSGIVVVRYPVGVAAIFQGNVGIGTTSPQAALHVTGNTILNGVVYGGKNCPSDMAYIGGSQPFCIDRYEAYNAGGYVANSACTSGSQAEVDASNTTAIAGSAAGQTPMVYVNWCDAKKACQNAGKHLCTNAEWFQACNYKGSQWSITAEEATEAMGCNTASSGANLTGASPNCVTQEGAYDLIGNVWEYVDKIVTADPTNGLTANNYVTGYDFSTGLPTSVGSTTNAYGNDYFWAYEGAGAARALARGGYWANGPGCFSLHLDVAPSMYSNNGVGFRCCK